MKLQFRIGTIADLNELRSLAIKTWSQFRPQLTKENWKALQASLEDEKTYLDLLRISQCVVCSTPKHQLIAMAYLVPSGNPTEIYQNNWSYLRFVTVDPEFAGQGIGRALTQHCLELAKANKETTIALHTSEMMEKAAHLYQSLGFKLLRELPKQLGKKYWLYKLEL